MYNTRNIADYKNSSNPAYALNNFYLRSIQSSHNLSDKLSITPACGYVSKRWFFAYAVAKNK